MSCNKQKHEVCLFNSGTYRCACPNGYRRLPDGRCLVINECENAKLNTCSPDAECVDLVKKNYYFLNFFIGRWLYLSM